MLLCKKENIEKRQSMKRSPSECCFPQQAGETSSVSYTHTVYLDDNINYCCKHCNAVYLKIIIILPYTVEPLFKGHSGTRHFVP